MAHRNFRMIDVFGDGIFAGNPLAVVADAADLDTAEMQRIAHWLNLSETTFLLPPDDPQADYRVQIFTVDRELPFAGHPTLGSAHAWLEQGGKPKTEGVVVQECGAGLVTLRRDGDRLAFAAPPRTRSGPDLRVAVARAVYTEVNARIQMQAVMLAAGGRVNYMAAEECALREGAAAGDKRGSGHGQDRIWEALKSALVDK